LSSKNNIKTKPVCIKCGGDWKSPSSPAVCRICGQDSVAIMRAK